MEKVAQMGALGHPLPDSAQEKALPKFGVVLQELHRRRQPEIVAEAIEQPNAVAVNRAEEGLLKCALHPVR